MLQELRGYKYVAGLYSIGVGPELGCSGNMNGTIRLCLTGTTFLSDCSMHIRISILPVLLCFFPLFGGAIVGTVQNAQSGKMIPEVTVSLLENDAVTFTDSSGAYRFDSCSPGTYTLTFQAAGFEPHKRNDVFVAGTGVKRVDVELVPQILTLGKMVVHSTAFHRSTDMSSSTKIINADELLRAPGALVDVQRVVQNLPSVTSGGDNVNEVVVRGGTPGENLLIMDNIEIVNANHFADQHSGGGVISLINPLLVKGLIFNAGAPPAQYGGKASSVIDVTLREGNEEIVLGGLDMGMAGAGGHLEGPLWNGANFMFSGHKSYLDVITHFDKDIPVPRFWGLQGKFAQHVKEQTLLVNGIYGKNFIKIEDTKEQVSEYDLIRSGGIVYAGGVSWKAPWRESFTTLLTLSGTGNTFDRFTKDISYDTVDTVVDPVTNDISYTTSTRVDTFFTGGTWNDEQHITAECSFDFQKSNRLILGVYAKRFEFMIDQQERSDTLKDYQDSPSGIPVLTADGEPRVYREYAVNHDTTYKYGGYVSGTLHACNRFRLVPGIRFDRLRYNNSFVVSPRFNTVISLNEKFDVTTAFGIQFQDPEFVDLVLDSRNNHLKPKRAITGIGGVEYYLDRFDVKLAAEGFYKKYDNLLFDASLLTPDSLDETDVLVDDGEGHTFGIELFVQKKLTGSFFWTAALALSKSLYKDLRPGHYGEWYDGDYDFRHTVTVTGGWKKDLLEFPWYKKKFHDKIWFKILHPFMPLADRIELSGKWRYLDGRPYTKQKYSSRYKRWYVDPEAPLNETRLKPYHRLDIRFERRYGFGFLQLIYYIDMQNVYKRENVWMYLYSDKTGKRLTIDQIPFFVSGGIIIGL